MTPQSQKLANAKYRQEKRDQLAVDIPKGKKDIYKQAAAEFGLSLSMFVQSGVEEFIASHIWSDFSPVKPSPMSPSPKLSAEERRLLDEFNQLPPEVQKSLLKLAKAINANSNQAANGGGNL